MTERIYLRNPYLMKLNAKILENEFKNNKFYIKLNKTIFYPNRLEGQIGDEGTISGIKVLDVYEENDDVIHVLNDLPTENTVELSIDWDIRFENMQQHTGQHIISGALFELFDFMTVNFQMNKYDNFIDINASFLTQNIIDKIESYSNRIVFSNFDIFSYTIDKKDISKLPIKELSDEDGEIRIVEIDKLDYSACRGIHHRRTGEVGIIKITNWFKVRENYRIEFVCGVKALEDYKVKNSIIMKLKKKLNVDVDNIIKSINK